MKQQNRNPNTKCTICDKEIYRRPKQLLNNPKAYCSQDCYGISCRKENPCIICKTPILATLNKITCSKECEKINYNRKERKHSLGRKATKNKNYGSKSFRKYFLEKNGHKCMLCPYSVSEVLNMHHIVERKNGGSNDESNLILVCPNCHAEIHAGLKTVTNKLTLSSQPVDGATHP